MLISHLDYFNNLIIVLNFTLFSYSLFKPSIQSGILKCNSTHMIPLLCSRSSPGIFACTYKRVVYLGLTFLLKTETKYSQEKVNILRQVLCLPKCFVLLFFHFRSFASSVHEKAISESCGSLTGLERQKLEFRATKEVKNGIMAQYLGQYWTT